MEFVGSSESQSNSADIPGGVEPGDLLLFFGFDAGSLTRPAVPAGFDDENTSGSNNCARRIASKVADGTETTVSSSGSTGVIVLAYRDTSGIGAKNGGAGAIGDPRSPSLNLQVKDGSSWVVSWGASRSTSGSPVAPAGMVERAIVNGSRQDMGAFDTDGGVTSWSGDKTPWHENNSGWMSFALELLA